MILADTPVWVDYLRDGDAVMAGLLGKDQVLMHPFVRGEIALCRLRHRAETLDLLDTLPRLLPAGEAEVHRLIENASLAADGIGYVDAHLLAAVRLAPGTQLWTRDHRLLPIAERLAIAANISH